MKFNVSVLVFGLIVLALNLVETVANSSDDLSLSKMRVNRRTHCGVSTFKLLMLICNNDLKFPSAEGTESKDLNNNDGQMMNYEPFIKRNQIPIQTADLLNNRQEESVNMKKFVDFDNLQDRISDVHVHNNPNYHRIKRSLIRDCCHRACTFKELENLC